MTTEYAQGVAQAAYDQLQVGSVGWLRPDSEKGETIEAFQAVAGVMDEMQRDGLIRIRSVHKESMSGRCLIDAIQFLKTL